MNKKIIEYALEAGDTTKIEFLIEEICNELNLNDSYFGNLIVAVLTATNCFEHCEQTNRIGKIKIEVSKKGRGLIFNFIADKEIKRLCCFEDEIEESKIKSDNDKNAFVIRKLSDKIEKTDKNIKLIFEISNAIDNSVDNRKTELDKYHTNNRQKVK